MENPVKDQPDWVKNLEFAYLIGDEGYEYELDLVEDWIWHNHDFYTAKAELKIPVYYKLIGNDIPKDFIIISEDGEVKDGQVKDDEIYVDEEKLGFIHNHSLFILPK